MAAGIKACHWWNASHAKQAARARHKEVAEVKIQRIGACAAI
jgi:hypothetical protein